VVVVLRLDRVPCRPAGGRRGCLTGDGGVAVSGRSGGGQVPSELPQAQALADAAVLLQVVEQLRGACLTRVADVDARKLHLLDGAGSTSSWVEQQHTSLDRGEVALARRMSSLPTLDAAVRSGSLSIAAAERVGRRWASCVGTWTGRTG
jgi:hypothetical protein